MPIVPSGPASPFASIQDVMNTARQRVNDMHNDASGDLLTNNAPYAQTLLTDAWTWLQDQCADAGVEANTSEVALYGLPARVTSDITQQAYVSWTGCSDGVGVYDTPALPQDLIIPMDIYRRSSGSNGDMVPMYQGVGGLPRRLDCNAYDWRGNSLYFYASQASQDFLIRYAAYFPDLDLTQPQYPVPMRGCKECLGSRIAFLFTNARQPGSPGATSLQELSEKSFADSIATRSSKKKQRMTVQRLPASSRGYGNPFPYQVSGGN